MRNGDAVLYFVGFDARNRDADPLPIGAGTRTDPDKVRRDCRL